MNLPKLLGRYLAIAQAGPRISADKDNETLQASAGMLCEYLTENFEAMALQHVILVSDLFVVMQQPAC